MHNVLLQGAMTGMICGFVASFAMFFGGANLSKPEYLLGNLQIGLDRCPTDCDYSLSPNLTYISVEPPTVPTGPEELHGIDNFYALSVFYMAPVGLMVSLLLGVIVSLLSGECRMR